MKESDGRDDIEGFGLNEQNIRSWTRGNGLNKLN